MREKGGRARWRKKNGLCSVVGGRLAHFCISGSLILWRTSTNAPQNTLFLWRTSQAAPQNSLFLWRTMAVRHRISYFCGAPWYVRHRNSKTNDWGCQLVGPTKFLWRTVLWCATKLSYFCGAPCLVRHKKSFCGAFFVVRHRTKLRL